MGSAVLVIDDRTQQPIEGIKVALTQGGLHLDMTETDGKGLMVYEGNCDPGCLWEVSGKIDDDLFYEPQIVEAVDEEIAIARMIPMLESAPGQIGSMGAASRVVVVDEPTGRVIKGASVALEQPDGSFQTATTDESGQAFSQGVKAGMKWEARTPYHYTGRIESTGNDVLPLKRVPDSGDPEDILGGQLTEEAIEKIQSGEEKFPVDPTVPVTKASSPFPWLPALALTGAAVGVALYLGGSDDDDEDEEEE